MAEPTYRIERDSMGDVKIPKAAYYGAQTQRAVENFPVSGIGFPEVMEGKLDKEFVVDIFQTGSGTSTNMNANEVIANRALELLGKPRGSKEIHPNDHVNLGQSSNDVIPTAVHIAALKAIQGKLLPALEKLHAELRRKTEEFDPVVKIGRTHLADATPIRLGQEFSGYARQIALSIERIRGAAGGLEELALGGTAVGTGINTHPEFPPRTIKKISQITDLPFREGQTISKPRRQEMPPCR